jgi:hypothetical protein
LAYPVIFAAVSFELIYNYPSWYLILCLVLAGGYTILLYAKKNTELAAWIRYSLASLRFVAVAIILFLLLNPLLKYTQTTSEKPIIVVGIDNSRSVVQMADSSYFRKDFQQDYNDFVKKLESKFNVASYAIGDVAQRQSEFKFDDQQTNLHSFLKLEQEAYEGQNVGAVVLASDGIFTKGLNPNYGISKQKSPIHTILFGDTTIRKDALISSIRSNQIAYLHNEFPVVIDVQVKKSKGETVVLSIYKDGKLFRSETLAINQSSYSHTSSFTLEAEAEGIQHYTVGLSSVSGEKYTANNQRSFYIEVLNSKQKILLCASATHPDLGALKRGIEQNENYEFTLKIGGLPNALDLKENSLIILHQYPSSASQLKPIQDILAKKVPLLFILGSQTDMNAYARLNTAMKVTGVRSGMNEATADLNSNFLLFELDKDLRNRFADLPPLYCPFGSYKSPLPNNVLFKQKIGVVPTDYPLLYFHNDEGYRSGFLSGEGWWRWAISEYRTHGDFAATNELLSKTIQYLSIKKDKRKLRVNPRKKSYSEGEVITFDGELYNDNYELTNRPDIDIVVSDEAGQKFPYVFGKTTNRYRAELGRLPAGPYSYVASGTLNSKKLKVQGTFMIKKPEAERINLEANHRLLKQLSGSTLGQSYSSTQWDDLATDLLNDSDLVPVQYRTNSFRELLNQKWLFFLIVFLFSVEWFVRKWNSI